MAHIIIGAGLGGVILAFELCYKLPSDCRITVVSKGTRYSFVPSNPWLAVGWRDRNAIEVPLEPIFTKRQIELRSEGARHVRPAESRIELTSGAELVYDYLILATGPDFAFDEMEGLDPDRHTASICYADHALEARKQVDMLMKKGGSVVIGAAKGASYFGPAYEFTFILDMILQRAGSLITFQCSGQYSALLPDQFSALIDTGEPFHGITIQSLDSGSQPRLSDCFTTV